MKRITGMVAAFLFLFVIAGIAPASDEKTEDGKSGKRLKQITGEVTDIDLKSQTVTVVGKNGMFSIALTEKTKVMRDREPKSLSDVQVGDRVTIKYRQTGGKQTAKSLHIKTAAKKSKLPT